MALSISHIGSARATLRDISDECESFIRGDERPVPTNHYTVAERLELFDKARAVAVFYHTIIERHGRRPEEFVDQQAFVHARQYASHLAYSLQRHAYLNAESRAALVDWLETDRRMPQLLPSFV